MTMLDGHPGTSATSSQRASVDTRLPTGRRGWRLRRALLLSDATAISVALFVAVALFGQGQGEGSASWALVLLPLWAVLFKVYDLYDRDGKRISHSTVDDVPRVFHALVVGSLGLWLFFRVLPLDRLVLGGGVAFFLVAFAAILVFRSIVRGVTRRADTPERTLMIGGNAMSSVLVRKLRAHPEYSVLPVGYLDEADRGDIRRLAGLPYLGSLDSLEEVCEREAIERVIMLPSPDQDGILDLIRRTRGLSVQLSLVPSGTEVLGPSVEVDDVEGITVLGVNPPILDRSSQALKRAMDLLFAAAALLLLAPLMVLIGVAVRLTSPGPAIFVQERVGRDGRRFPLRKFRTMVQDADDHVERLRKRSSDPDWLLLDHDPRITRLGRQLRRSSLDELPQLWNVIRGDMSLVGPRPLTPVDHDHVVAWGRRRLDLTPGLTGLWQVLGRTTIGFEEMVKLDYLYVTNWSLWGDVRLLIRTLPAVLRQRGAN